MRIACSQQTKDGKYFTVCIYDPAGNISNEFKENVLPINPFNPFKPKITINRRTSITPLTTAESSFLETSTTASNLIENNDKIDLVIDLTTSNFLKECLKSHNEKRRLHNVDDLTFDEKLLFLAKQSVADLALNGLSNKSNRNSFLGENIGFSNYPINCDEIIDYWYNKNYLYDFQTPRLKTETRNFAQVK